MLKRSNKTLEELKVYFYFPNPSHGSSSNKTLEELKDSFVQ